MNGGAQHSRGGCGAVPPPMVVMCRLAALASGMGQGLHPVHAPHVFVLGGVLGGFVGGGGFFIFVFFFESSPIGTLLYWFPSKNMVIK